MEKSWMPTTAGILNLICGAADIIGGIVLLIIGAISGIIFKYAETDIPPFILMLILIILGIFVLILGVIALLGGVYALRRKVWGMALAGSIVSFFIIWPLGIASIIFIALSRNEFS
jgi:hypothetical protein